MGLLKKEDLIMKKKLVFPFIMIAGLMACNDEELSNSWHPVKTGDEISFGAESGNFEYNLNGEKPQTRTAYGEEIVTQEGKRLFPINWEDGDIIGIYCPQASAPLPYKEVDYKIIFNKDEPNNGTLAKVEMGSNGLQWGDADEHHFYAMYPASATRGGVSATEMKANIPMVQEPESVDYSEESGLYMVNPNMDYAYMYAHQKVSKAEQGNVPITLDFKPLVTTLRITINGPKEGEPLQVSQVEIRSTEGIAGDFKLTISPTEVMTGDDGKCTPLALGTINNLVTIPTYYNGKAITLKPGEKMVLKAFMLPYANPDMATTSITVRMVGQGTKTKILNTAEIQSQKINLTSLPALEGTDLSYWMTSLEPNTYVSQLSIPGTHNSYSNPDYASWTGEHNLMTRYQGKTIKEQFEAGARAFSFMVDKDMNVYSAFGKLGAMTLTDAMDEYYTMLAQKIEEYDSKYPGNAGNCRDFIVVYIDYRQLLGGNPGDDEQKKERLEWLINLDAALNSWQHNARLVSNLTSTTTVEDLRQNIVVLARYQGIAYNYTWIDSTWPLYHTISYDPDNMELFTILRQPYSQTTDWGNSKFSINNDRDIIGNYVIPGEGKTVGSVSEDGNTVNSNLYYWHQSLQRLQNEENATIWPKMFVSDTQEDDHTDRISRKIDDVKALFEAAMKNNDPNDKSDIGLKNWYINNLGAFCVIDEDRSTNANYGDGGNSLLAAEEINIPVYNYLLERDVNAPIGIIMMNFLGEDIISYGRSYTTNGIKLAQMIIDNNFKYELKVKSSGETGR